jgi:UDP-N-acetylglucosamine 2-epimerase (non-hydrolysing)
MVLASRLSRRERVRRLAYSFSDPPFRVKSLPNTSSNSTRPANGRRSLVLVPGAASTGGPATIVHVVGARPNFVKMAPVIAALEGHPSLRQVIVHTGQHYDRRMSEEILEDLGFPTPDRFLGVGSGSHAEQTAKVLVEMENVLSEIAPVAVVVAGDVNSTLAAALAASKLGIPIAHLEAGLRSGDWSMPEEINRVVTDRLSDLLFTHSPEAEEHLAAEGIEGGRVHYVGNTMIDSLRRCERRARDRAVWEQLGVRQLEYILVTLHRPSNVDVSGRLMRIVDALVGLAKTARIVFPIHPRTRARLESEGALERLEAAGVACIEPVGYLDFLSLQCGAGAIVTDSGGVQEEASALGISCYTFRPNTERPVTLTHGTNVLLGDDPADLLAVRPAPYPPTPSAIPMWDGHAGERVAQVLAATYALTRYASAGAT